jgi:hypothetical protein
MAIFTGRLFKNKNITALSFFAVGVLYAINAPQGKYVSGGVVGNILGNMFLPVALYFLSAYSNRSVCFVLTLWETISHRVMVSFFYSGDAPCITTHK